MIRPCKEDVLKKQNHKDLEEKYIDFILEVFVVQKKLIKIA